MSFESALEAVRRGQIVGLPTDTVYGIAADPFDESAVAELFAAKGRPGVKPIPILAADLDGVSSVARLDGDTGRLASRHWPGPLTLVLQRVEGAPDWVGDPQRDTVGVRVPDHPVALELLRSWGPLAVTSANRSGGTPTIDDTQARSVLGDAVAVYLEGRSGGGVPSTVVDLTGAEPRVLRRGPVEWGER